MQTCAKDGLTEVSNDAQSGCNGGPGFACSNQIPAQLNDQVSFGFVAAKLGGQQESDWCCSCYELIFTGEDNQGGSSAKTIKGKRFIVQATNTGGDLGENHFDLMIPGGGVGIFNGCKPQWGAPDQGWGQRYGGVGSIQVIH